MEPIAIIIISVLFVMLLKLTGKSRKEKLIDQLPGPPGVPFFGNAFQFIGVDRCDRMTGIMKRDKQYGPIYRNWIVSQPYVHITTAELAEPILNLKNTAKGQVYTFLQTWFGLGLLTSDGETWSRSRKLITPTFHFQILEGYIDIFRDSTRTLIKKIKEHADNDTPFDIYPFLTLAALDSISETAMGTKINAQENAQSEYVKSVYNILRLIFYRYDRFWLHNDWMWSKSPAGQEAKKTLEILHGFTGKVIQERKLARQNVEQDDVDVEGKRKKVFIDLLLDESDSQKAGFTDVQLRDEVNTFMFEGHDTTTNAVSFVLLLLAAHPDVQEAVYKEQLDILGSSTDDAPTVRDLNEMKCLDRVFKEALRLYPSVPFISRTLRDDVKLGDYIIPGGTVAFISLASILRDTKYFPNPDKFDPDRFLPENSVGRHPYANIPFSAGPRNCIGKRFAVFEGKVMLSYIVRNFRIEPHTTLQNCKTIIEIVQKPANGLFVKLYSRNKA